jgi:hypothetical protein
VDLAGTERQPKGPIDEETAARCREAANINTSLSTLQVQHTSTHHKPYIYWNHKPYIYRNHKPTHHKPHINRNHKSHINRNLKPTYYKPHFNRNYKPHTSQTSYFAECVVAAAVHQHAVGGRSAHPVPRQLPHKAGACCAVLSVVGEGMWCLVIRRMTCTMSYHRSDEARVIL